MGFEKFSFKIGKLLGTKLATAAQLHVGERLGEWQSRNKPFGLCFIDRGAIVDLDKTLAVFRLALLYTSRLVSTTRRTSILFVNGVSEPENEQLAISESEELLKTLGYGYVLRWMPGYLSNLPVLIINFWRRLPQFLKENRYKRARAAMLRSNYNGIKLLDRFPDQICFFSCSGAYRIGVDEALSLGVPSIIFGDTASYPKNSLNWLVGNGEQQVTLRYQVAVFREALLRSLRGSVFIETTQLNKEQVVDVEKPLTEKDKDTPGFLSKIKEISQKLSKKKGFNISKIKKTNPALAALPLDIKRLLLNNKKIRYKLKKVRWKLKTDSCTRNRVLFQIIRFEKLIKFYVLANKYSVFFRTNKTSFFGLKILTLGVGCLQLGKPFFKTMFKQLSLGSIGSDLGFVGKAGRMHRLSLLQKPSKMRSNILLGKVYKQTTLFRRLCNMFARGRKKKLKNKSVLFKIILGWWLNRLNKKLRAKNKTLSAKPKNKKPKKNKLKSKIKTLKKRVKFITEALCVGNRKPGLLVNFKINMVRFRLNQRIAKRVDSRFKERRFGLLNSLKLRTNKPLFVIKQAAKTNNINKVIERLFNKQQAILKAKTNNKKGRTLDLKKKKQVVVLWWLRKRLCEITNKLLSLKQTSRSEKTGGLVRRELAFNFIKIFEYASAQLTGYSEKTLLQRLAYYSLGRFKRIGLRSIRFRTNCLIKHFKYKRDGSVGQRIRKLNKQRAVDFKTRLERTSVWLLWLKTRLSRISLFMSLWADKWQRFGGFWFRGGRDHIKRYKYWIHPRYRNVFYRAMGGLSFKALQRRRLNKRNFGKNGEDTRFNVVVPNQPGDSRGFRHKQAFNINKQSREKGPAGYHKPFDYRTLFDNKPFKLFGRTKPGWLRDRLKRYREGFFTKPKRSRLVNKKFKRTLRFSKKKLIDLARKRTVFRGITLFNVVDKLFFKQKKKISILSKLRKIPIIGSVGRVPFLTSRARFFSRYLRRRRFYDKKRSPNVRVHYPKLKDRAGMLAKLLSVSRFMNTTRQNRRWRLLRKIWTAKHDRPNKKGRSFRKAPYVPKHVRFVSWLYEMSKRWRELQFKNRKLKKKVVKTNPYKVMFEQKTDYEKALQPQYDHFRPAVSFRSYIHSSLNTRALSVFGVNLRSNAVARSFVVNKLFRSLFTTNKVISRKTDKWLFFKPPTSLVKRTLRNLRYRASWLTGSGIQKVLVKVKKKRRKKQSFLFHNKALFLRFKTAALLVKWRQNKNVALLLKTAKLLPLRIALLKLRLFRYIRYLRRCFYKATSKSKKGFKITKYVKWLQAIRKQSLRKKTPTKPKTVVIFKKSTLQAFSSLVGERYKNKTKRRKTRSVTTKTRRFNNTKLVRQRFGWGFVRRRKKTKNFLQRTGGKVLVKVFYKLKYMLKLRRTIKKRLKRMWFNTCSRFVHFTKSKPSRRRNRIIKRKVKFKKEKPYVQTVRWVFRSFSDESLLKKKTRSRGSVGLKVLFNRTKPSWLSIAIRQKIMNALVSKGFTDLFLKSQRLEKRNASLLIKSWLGNLTTAVGSSRFPLSIYRINNKRSTVLGYMV